MRRPLLPVGVFVRLRDLSLALRAGWIKPADSLGWC